jgi:hypothetical protein
MGQDPGKGVLYGPEKVTLIQPCGPILTPKERRYAISVVSKFVSASVKQNSNSNEYLFVYQSLPTTVVTAKREPRPIEEVEKLKPKR